MKLNVFDRALLALAAMFLGVMALRPLFTPEIARAQEMHPNLYIEPGVRTILSPDRTRQVKGKIVVDLSNGNIWGFPTAEESPYPIDRTRPQPATSVPIYLGRFDLAAMQKGQ
jgi:hypothetical protein